ncbi:MULTISPECIES: type II toxin-antitoxin system RelE family toxin [unclassified Campylobacter]|uniref:type II toxin-antitoxin system RelE family toxin n=1 Tax=unclassified Campylobacter TaxID=2593542 RepID=UPI003D3453DF
MNINISFTKKADKFFFKHEDIRAKFIQNITKFAKGDKVDIKALAGTNEPIYRMRISKYRIIFSINANGEIIAVIVLDAGSRGDIYK